MSAAPVPAAIYTVALHLRRFFSNVPPGIKLALLFLLSLIAFYSSSLWLLGALSLAPPLLFLACGFGRRGLRQNLLIFAVLALCLSAFQLLNTHISAAAATGLRLFGITACAAFISATTASSALLRILERSLKLFTLLGVNARQIALALMLVLRFLPLLTETHAELRAAQTARGAAKRNLRGQAQLLSLTLIRLITAQENITEAIEARGFEQPAEKRKSHEP